MENVNPGQQEVVSEAVETVEELTSEEIKDVKETIDAAVEEGFEHEESIEDVLCGDYVWEDLKTLKDELASAVIGLTLEIGSIVSAPAIMNNLGEKKEHVSKMIQVFYKDVDRFSSKVAKVRVEHEDKVGKLTDIEEFNTYNRVAITYQNLYTELNGLLAPTMADIVLTISETAAAAVAPADSEVTDVVVTEEKVTAEEQPENKEEQ